MQKNNNDNGEGSSEFDLSSIMMILWLARYRIILLSGIITIGNLSYLFLIAPEIYRSEATVLPLSSASGGSMMSQLGGLATLVGVDAPKSENTTELILQSRSLLEEVVNRKNLEKEWNCGKQEAVRELRKMYSVMASRKNSLIAVSCESDDPEFSQDVVRRSLDIASEEMENHSRRKSAARAKFLEKRVADALVELKASEDELKEFQLKNEGVEIELQAQALITQIHGLKEEMQKMEVELQVAKKRYNSDSIEVRQLKWTIVELDNKIDQLRGGDQKQDPTYEKEALSERRLMDIPGIGLEIARRMRAVKLNQKIYGLLLEQFELAKIEGQKESESFEVIDPPIIPDRKIRPKRIIGTVIGALAGMLFAFSLTLLLHFFQQTICQKKSLAVN